MRGVLICWAKCKHSLKVSSFEAPSLQSTGVWIFIGCKLIYSAKSDWWVGWNFLGRTSKPMAENYDQAFLSDSLTVCVTFAA